MATGFLHTAIAGADANLVTMVTDGCAGTQVAALGTCTVMVKLTPPTGTAAHSLSGTTLTVSGTPGNSTSTTLTGMVQ